MYRGRWGDAGFAADFGSCITVKLEIASAAPTKQSVTASEMRGLKNPRSEVGFLFIMIWPTIKSSEEQHMAAKLNQKLTDALFHFCQVWSA